MKIFKSYGFWTAFAGAVVILVNALGDLFGFKIESKLIENAIMAVAGVLVALGVVSMGTKKEPPIADETVADKSEDKTAAKEELPAGNDEQKTEQE